ncbi:MAG: hypothetical protein KatS3mg084_0420 [Candidatus Dojkabacteria bacterium]|nr:MAG: hypothetical protein KatS3mg084_0420 [Candidatus Dojkabacteria bacterium]
MGRRLNLGRPRTKRELEFLGVILFIFISIIFALYIGFNSNIFNFDTRKDAAGRTIYLESGQDLQTAINNANDSDAIFLRPGTYTSPNGKPFEIKNKNIRILGSGTEYTTLRSNSNQAIIALTNAKLSLESLSITGSPGDGIKTDDSSQTELKLINTIVSNNVGYGVSANAKTTVLTSIIDQNGKGIFSRAPLIVENTVIRNNANNGITIEDSINAQNDSRIVNVLLYSNKGTQIQITGGRNHIVKNVTLYDGGKGIITSIPAGRQNNTTNFSVAITNSIIQKHSGEGVVLVGEQSSIRYSNVYQNGTNYLPPTLANSEGNLSVDSEFVGANNFKLRSTSQLKNKGTPGEKNTDGSRIDIGAYGGTSQLLSPNNPPQITSKPINYIKPEQTYNYEIQATDHDNDALTYILTNDRLPHWLRLDKNKLTGTPSQQDVGYYGVIIVVSDGRGGNTVHPISINVLPSGVDIPPTQASDTDKPTPTPISRVAPNIQILSPNAGTVFSKTNNEIKWNVNEGATIEKFTISYSTNGQDYTIITTLPGSTTSYKWKDIDKVISGKYFIKIEATDNSNPPVTVAAISEQFEISIEQEQSARSITITKNSPADNDVVRDPKQQIVVEFKPDAEIDKSKTFIKVNGNEVAYSTTINTIFYQPTVPYEGNRVEVEVKIVTKEGATASKQWVFNIQRQAAPSDTTPDTIVTAKICVPGTQLCVPQTVGVILIGLIVFILLVVILYLIIKTIKYIREQREGNLEAEFTEYYGDSNNLYADPKNQSYNPNDYITSSNNDINQNYTNPSQTNQYQQDNSQQNFIQDQTTSQNEQTQTYTDPNQNYSSEQTTYQAYTQNSEQAQNLNQFNEYDKTYSYKDISQGNTYGNDQIQQTYDSNVVLRENPDITTNNSYATGSTYQDDESGQIGQVSMPTYTTQNVSINSSVPSTYSSQPTQTTSQPIQDSAQPNSAYSQPTQITSTDHEAYLQSLMQKYGVNNQSQPNTPQNPTPTETSS